jgi:hypothetical protein
MVHEHCPTDGAHFHTKRGKMRGVPQEPGLPLRKNSGI